MRRGFTLIELLATMVVMGIVGGMLALALNGARADARRTRAIGQVRNLTEMLMQRYEEESERRLPAVKPVTVGSVTYSLRSAEEAGRIRLLMTREYLRAALPDRKSDLLFGAAPLQVLLQSSTGATYAAYTDMSVHNQIRNRYLTRLSILTGSASDTTGTTTEQQLANYTAGSNAGWSEANESSECLYLILSSAAIDGVPMLESFRAADIQDTDGDGVPEILDPWGRPVVWMRWPAGYWLTYNDRGLIGTAQISTAMAEKASALGEDGMDYLKSDWGFSDTTNPPDWGNGDRLESDNPFTCMPLVVSAGSDGVLDLLTKPDYLSLGDGALPTAAPFPGYGRMRRAAPSGYAATYYYPDPYCRSTSTAENFGSGNSYDYATSSGTITNALVGSYYDENADSEDNSIDNIFGSTP